jgi:hypothetical protein
MYAGKRLGTLPFLCLARIGYQVIVTSMDSSVLLIALYATIAIPLVLVVVGLAIGILTSVVNRVLSTILGSIVYRGGDTLFLPGVIMHEMSHALFLFITGAKIGEIVVRADSRHPWVLYRARGVSPSRGITPRCTGYVSFGLRGPFLVKSFQRVLGSVAPTVMGLACMALLIGLITTYCTAWWHYAICIYLLLCALNGSGMSTLDVKDMLPGIPVCLVLVYVVLLTTQYNPFSAYPALEVLLPGI